MSANDARKRYPPISSYAFLSDTHTAALVGPDAAIEWLCVPRFDGESVFARILDRERGGAFELNVEDAGLPAQHYLGDTLVLESPYEARTGVVVVLNSLAVRRVAEGGGDELAAEHVLVRLMRCESGSAQVRARIDARPGYGAEEAEWRSEDATLWRTSLTDLWLSSDAPLRRGGPGLSSEVELRVGEEISFALGYADEAPGGVPVFAAGRLLEETRRAWQGWSNRCPYEGFG